MSRCRLTSENSNNTQIQHQQFNMHKTSKIYHTNGRPLTCDIIGRPSSVAPQDPRLIQALEQLPRYCGKQSSRQHSQGVRLTNIHCLRRAEFDVILTSTADGRSAEVNATNWADA